LDIGLGTVLAFALTAFYWLPALSEVAWIRAGQVSGSADDMATLLAPLAQFVALTFTQPYVPDAPAALQHPLNLLVTGVVLAALALTVTQRARFSSAQRRVWWAWLVIALLMTLAMLDLSAPPLVVWEWLNDPVQRSQCYSEIRPIARPSGRLKVGAVNHCVHGKAVDRIATIVDWRPFDYFTAEQINASKPMVFTYTSQLSPQPNGTRLSTYGQLKFSGPMALLKPLGRFLLKYGGVHKRYEKLGRILNAGGAQDVSYAETANQLAH